MSGTEVRGSGIPSGVAVAGCLFAVLLALILIAANGPAPAAAAMVELTVGAVLALAGGIVLDHRPAGHLGRAFVALSFLVLLGAIWSFVTSGRSPADGGPELTSELAVLGLVGFVLAVPLSVRPPGMSPTSLMRGWAGAGVAAVGAVLLTWFRVDSPARNAAGWALCAAGSAIVWATVARSGWRAHRTDRRRVGWTLALTGAVVAVLAASATWFDAERAASLTGLAAIVAVVLLARLEFVTGLRPFDEVALDLALALGVVVTAGGIGLLVGFASRWTGLLNQATWTAYGAVVAVAVAAPAAVALRRGVLAARYGRGVIAPDALAEITADLRAQGDPRELLDKAAGIVASASRSRRARIVLGPDEPDLPDGWSLYPLMVGSDRVGSLVVAFRGLDGPEDRQRRAIVGLLPTVALVARAVSLAVEAELARRDVARERAEEQRRILRDLHDGLGPTLAGMSMRVRAALRTEPPAEYRGLLDDLADELAAVRAELRGVVAGLTPSALDHDDLATALRRLVDTFRASATVAVDLTITDLDDTAISRDAQVTVYRCVAEGLTNALRHAAPTAVRVRVGQSDGRLTVELTDDGTGVGPVVPGVGLSSLAHRAAACGGSLDVERVDGGGTRLRMRLPVGRPNAGEAVA